VGSHQSGVEGQNPFPPLDLLATLLLMQPRIWLAFWAASAHCWVILSLLSTRTPKSFSAALNPLNAQPVSMFGIVPTQVQYFTLGHVELHGVCMGPLL